MTDIFISYSHDDKPWIETLVNALESQGYTLWWDRAILPGQDFETRIRAALDNTKCVIAVWSETSVESKWVKAESNLAWERDQLISLLISDVFERIPVQMRTSLVLDFQNWSGDQTDPRFQQLLQSINSHTQNTPIISAPETSPGTRISRTLRSYWKWALAAFLFVGGIAGAALDLEQLGQRFFNPTPKLALSYTSDGEVNPGDRINLTYKATSKGYLSLWNQDANGESTLVLPQTGMTPLHLNTKIISGQIGLKARNDTGTDQFILLWTPEDKPKHLPHRQYATKAEFTAALKVLEDKDSLVKTAIEVPVYPGQ